MKNSKTAFTLIELLVVLAIVCILMAFAVSLFGGGCTQSEGSRVGLVTKFSYKGKTSATKSWEGELAMPGTSSGANGALTGNVWEFSVLDASVVKQVEALQDSGHRAKLRYRQTISHNPLARETSYVVIEAIDLEAANAPRLERR